jgi:retinol dehydrogenase-12
MGVGNEWTIAGKTCMVTGASSGIGKAAAIELARRGAELILVCRDATRGKKAAAEITDRTANARADIMLADLSSQAQIRRLARQFLESGRPLHVLLNNAGLMLSERAESVDGIEMTFAVNHVAYFLLTTLLLDRLQESAPARVVNVASDAHRFAYGRLNFDDLHARRRYAGMRVYGQSKLANILFTRELARRLAGTSVTVNCLHPGTVATRFGQNNRGIMRWGTRLIAPFVRTPEKGAETAVYLCVAPAVATISGAYFFDKREKRPSPAAENDDDARRLWEVSAQLTGLSATDSRLPADGR